MYYIYYHDGYYGDGDVGMRACTTEKEVEAFVLDRMSRDSKRTLEDYTVINGKKVEMLSVETVRRIQLVTP